jgi:hypothetical protein
MVKIKENHNAGDSNAPKQAVVVGRTTGEAFWLKNERIWSKIEKSRRKNANTAHWYGDNFNYATLWPIIE